MLQLPPEILISVFASLGSIDDVYSLAATCRLLREVFHINELPILKRVIESSPTHCYDGALSHLQNANKFVGGEKSLCPTRPHYSSRAPAEYGDLLNLGSYKVKQTQVRGIVARWRAVRSLYRLYIDDTVKSLYNNSLFPYLNKETDMFNSCSTKDRHPVLQNALQGMKSAAYQLPYPDQLAKFYTALIRYWICVEAACSASRARYREAWEAEDFHGAVSMLWHFADGKDIYAHLTLLEVYDFVYGFLLRNAVLETDLRPKWFASTGTNSSEDWTSYLAALRSNLRPTHILQLLVLLRDGNATTENIETVLESTGLYEDLYGNIDASSLEALWSAAAVESIMPFIRMQTLTTLERGLYIKFSELERAQSSSKSNILLHGALFRLQWPETARGRVLSWREDERTAAEKFVGLSSLPLSLHSREASAALQEVLVVEQALQMYDLDLESDAGSELGATSPRFDTFSPVANGIHLTK